MNIVTLKYFVQVCEDRCLTRSAHKLFISQQALSRQILNLETELGVTLFQRNSRGMSPTAMGDYLYAKTLGVIDSISVLENDIRTRQQHHEPPHYRLGFSPGTLQSLGVQRVMEFLASNKEADCELSEHSDIECEARVDNGSLDMAITVRPRDTLRLRYISLKQERIVLVSNEQHRLARLTKTRPIRLTDMVDVSLIMLDETFRLQETILQHLHQAGVSPHIHTRISHDLHVAYDLVTLNKGVFVFVEGLARPLLRDGMMLIPIPDNGMAWDIGLITRHESTAHSPALTNFITHFQREMHKAQTTIHHAAHTGCPSFS